MPNKFFIVLVAASVSFFSCSSSKHSKQPKNLMPGTWQSTPIVIDGDSKDWPSPYPNYDAKAMVAYATSNDKENLYITMETGDELTQMKILKQGMTVSIDTSGKKEQQLNINYPLENDDDPLEMANNGLKKGSHPMHIDNQYEQKIDKNAKEANQFSLDGFQGCTGGFVVSQTLACGIKVRVRIDEYKELVWEAVVPFKAIYNKDVITAADANRPISVCFAVKAFKKVTKDVENVNGGSGMNSNSSNGGMSGGGRGGGGRGGGKGGARNTTEDPLAHLYENTKTWKQFMIAYQK